MMTSGHRHKSWTKISYLKCKHIWLQYKKATLAHRKSQSSMTGKWHVKLIKSASGHWSIGVWNNLTTAMNEQNVFLPLWFWLIHPHWLAQLGRTGSWPNSFMWEDRSRIVLLWILWMVDVCFMTTTVTEMLVPYGHPFLPLTVKCFQQATIS